MRSSSGRPLAGLLFCILGLAPTFVSSQVTIYGQTPLGLMTATTSGDAATATQTTTTLAAYDETILNPPDLPSPLPAVAYTLELQRDASAVNGLSIPQKSGHAFFGFSIEMSVISQVLGKNSTHLQVPLLNLLANIVARAGAIAIRIGGNTQEIAAMVSELDNYHATAKEDGNTQRTTDTPAVLYTKDLFYMAGNISSMVNVDWFFGVPFNDTTNWRLDIIENAEAILGDRVLGIQAGNEPDLYASHKSRNETYTAWDYFGEVSDLLTTVDANENITFKNNFITPSVSGTWTPEQIWDTGFIDAYVDRMYAFVVERYPKNNCFANYGTGTYQDPQTNFPDYLTHMAGVNLVEPYLYSSLLAQQHNKPFMMFETNTASCGGFPGISNSYGAALWALDYGMQMAYSNFSNAFLHVGGQNVYYNPFTSPPTNQSSFHEWTVGAVYYSALVMAEVFGKTNTSRIIDLWGNSGSVYTPSYAIYENDVLSKVALINYMDDPTGGSDLSVTVSVPNAGVPASVKVKYLESTSVSTRNITWAGQTFGDKFESDGRLKGDLNVTTITCDQTANACIIPVKAPGFALVFLDTTTDAEMLDLGQATATYSTTAVTKTKNTVTIDPSVLATSNGHNADERGMLGSTSSGSVNKADGGRREMVRAVVGVVGGVVAGTAMLLL